MDKQPVSVHKYLTNVSHDLALIPTESGTFTGAEISIPARSVVTVVYDLADSTVVPNGMVNVPMAATPSGVVYDLSGRCVGNSWNDMKGRRPGIYIVDGKKALLR
jgi:hypothetical protein